MIKGNADGSTAKPNPFKGRSLGGEAIGGDAGSGEGEPQLGEPVVHEAARGAGQVVELLHAVRAGIRRQLRAVVIDLRFT